MLKSVHEFCRICDYSRDEKTDLFVNCRAAGVRAQLSYVSRGWCGCGKVSGVPVKFIHADSIETRDRRYARRGSEEQDSVLRKALRTQEGLEKFEIPLVNSMRKFYRNR